MSTHPNVILLCVLKPDSLTRKTLRQIREDAGVDADGDDDIKIGSADYHLVALEDDYDLIAAARTAAAPEKEKGAVGQGALPPIEPPEGRYPARYRVEYGDCRDASAEGDHDWTKKQRNGMKQFALRLLDELWQREATASEAIAAARQAASPVFNGTAVGEGELPKVDDRGESVRAAFNGSSEDEANALFQLYVRERQLREERKAHKLAIAQRDEVKKCLHNVAIGCHVIDAPRAKTLLQFLSGENPSALDVAKPEELEGLKYDLSKFFPGDWQAGFNAAIDKVLDLRSLPSEPQDGNRKAVENGN